MRRQRRRRRRQREEEALPSPSRKPPPLSRSQRLPPGLPQPRLRAERPPRGGATAATRKTGWRGRGLFFFGFRFFRVFRVLEDEKVDAFLAPNCSLSVFLPHGIADGLDQEDKRGLLLTCGGDSLLRGQRARGRQRRNIQRQMAMAKKFAARAWPPPPQMHVRAAAL